MITGQHENAYVTSNIQYQDGGQNMFGPGLSRTDSKQCSVLAH